MTPHAFTFAFGAVLAASIAACGGSTEQQSPAGAARNMNTPAGDVASSTPVGQEAIHADMHGRLAVATITLKSVPDPAKVGENSFEITVMDHEKQPVTDAEVSAEFYMPATPSMNMPEMRHNVPLKHSGGGTYVGLGNLPMAGAWNVTVSVKRGTDVSGTRFKVTAK